MATGSVVYRRTVTVPFTPAPLPAEALEAVLQPLDRSRMLPPEAYTSDEVFAWEKAHLFSGWQCIGRSDSIPEPRMQRAEQVGDTSVLLVRGEDGVLRAFANTCRHRGHELLPCSSEVSGRAIRCPYHSWTFSLEGELIGTPGYTGHPDFDKSQYPLRSLAVQEWHGWIFLDPSGAAGPLAAHLDGIEPRVVNYAPEDLVVQGRHEYVVQANWKIVIENYQECYHCTSIHPELCQVSPPDSGANMDQGSGAWVGGWLDLRPHAVTMSLDGHSDGTFIPGLTEVEQHRIDYLAIFPNLLVSLHPDYVMTHRMVPLSARETWIECLWAFPREALALPGFTPDYAIDFWDITNRQDWSACESVHRGLSSGFASAGPIAPREDGVHQFVSMIARGYLGRPLGAVQHALPAQG